MGFEPTPSSEEQNAHSVKVKRLSLESAALDRSAILTYQVQKTIESFTLISVDASSYMNIHTLSLEHGTSGDDLRSDRIDHETT